MHFNYLIKNGTVVDGTGSKPVKSDVGIKNQTIEVVGDLSTSVADNVLDANGMIVSPGFIDVHSHADGALLIDGQHASGIKQGVTTEIIAPDGLTLAPLSKTNYPMYRQYLSGILGLPPVNIDMSSIEAARKNYHKKTACNVATFAAHGPIRIESIGMNDKPLKGKSLNKALKLLSESLEQGAVGFSTGLSYYPNSYSDTEELIEFMKVTEKTGKPLSIHLRNHNIDRSYVGGGIEEAIEIGRKTNAKIHIEHYKTQPGSENRLDELLNPIDNAKREGIDITLETYPYPVGSSFPQAFFPGWVHEGGPKDMISRFTDPSIREKILIAMKKMDYSRPTDSAWTHIGSKKNKQLEGVAFEDLAKTMNISVHEMLIKVMVEENLTCGFRGIPPDSVSSWRQIEKDVMTLLERPDYMVGSDSIPVGGLPHPRAYGCFARIIGRLRRRYNIKIEDLIQRMTENPALRFGLTKRGTITKGSFADIVIFDGENVNDQSSFEDPRVHPVGIHHVFVNGKMAVKNQETTGILAGESVP